MTSTSSLLSIASVRSSIYSNSWVIPLWNLLRIESVISVNLYYITVSWANIIFEKVNIKFFKTDVKWTSCRWKLKFMTIEIHNYMHYWNFFLHLIKPPFNYISAGLMRSASHGDVFMMHVRPDIKPCCMSLNRLFAVIWFSNSSLTSFSIIFPGTWVKLIGR